ncbi:ABC transporter permease [Candidatus Woesearchaeota archaeon]|nr:ABC transporter permease [Candidatus Woesearchaeota archaeon]
MKYRIIKALLLQYSLMTIKSLDRIADIVFWPTLSILMWGFTTLFLQKGYNVNIIGLILAGFIFYQFFQRCQSDIALYLLEDLWSDNLQNVYSTPVTKWDKLVSLVIFGVLKSLLAFGTAAFLSLVFFKFNLFSYNLTYLFFYFFSLSLFSIGIGILLVSLVLRFGTNIQMFVWGFSFMLQPLIAVFYPVSILPVFLQKISLLIPATYVFEGLRGLRESGIFDYGEFFYSIFLNLILIIIACVLYAMAFSHNKKTGRLVHSN